MTASARRGNVQRSSRWAERSRWSRWSRDRLGSPRRPRQTLCTS